MVLDLKRFSDIEPDREEIFNEFKKTGFYKQGNYDKKQLESIFLEIATRLMFKKISQEGKIIFDPIKPGTVTRNFLFSRCPYSGNTLVWNKDGSNRCELDLLMFSEKPIIAEIKVEGYSYFDGQRLVNYNVEKAMSFNEVNKKSYPIREKYRTRTLDYIVVAAPEHAKHGWNQEDDLRYNGTLLSFPYTRNEFTKKFVQPSIEEYHL